MPQNGIPILFLHAYIDLRHYRVAVRHSNRAKSNHDGRALYAKRTNNADDRHGTNGYANVSACLPVGGACLRVLLCACESVCVCSCTAAKVCMHYK